MTFYLGFVYLCLLSNLVSTFVTKKSQLYLELSHKVSHTRNSSQNGDTAVTLW